MQDLIYKSLIMLQFITLEYEVELEMHMIWLRRILSSISFSKGFIVHERICFQPITTLNWNLRLIFIMDK